MMTMTVVETLTKISCGECGGVYAIGERYRQQCHTEGTCWTCPYCKISWGYANNSENARLKDENERLQRHLGYANEAVEYHRKESDHFRASRNAVKGVLTKVKRRVANGVCPCCKRTFANLHEHMKQQHPTFTEPSP